MEALAEGSFGKAKGKQRQGSDAGFSRRRKTVGLGERAAMGTASRGIACCCLYHLPLVEQAPISNPQTTAGLCQGNPLSITGSRILWLRVCTTPQPKW